MDRLVKAIQEIDGPRLIVVGGAGSLFVATGVTLEVRPDSMFASGLFTIGL